MLILRLTVLFAVLVLAFHGNGAAVEVDARCRWHLEHSVSICNIRVTEDRIDGDCGAGWETMMHFICNYKEQGGVRILECSPAYNKKRSSTEESYWVHKTTLTEEEFLNTDTRCREICGPCIMGEWKRK